MKIKANSMTSNMVTNYIRYGLTIFIFVLLTPHIIKHVGISDYGIWVLVYSTLGFFGVLDLGFSTSVVKYVSECRGQGDWERRNKIVSTLLVVFVFQSVVILFLVFIFSGYFNQIFSIPSSKHDLAVSLVWLLSLKSIVLCLPLSVFKGVLFGEKKICQINMIQSVTFSFYGIISYSALSNGYGLVDIALISLVTMLIEHLLYIYLSFKSIQHLKVSFYLFDISILKEVAGFSFYQFIINISVIIVMRLDPIVIKVFLTLQAVAIYAIALKISENAKLFVKQYINVLTPYIGEAYGAGNLNQLKDILIKGTKYACVPGILILTLCAEFGDDVIQIWVGPEFIESGLLLIILMLVVYLSIPQMVISNVLATSGHHKYVAKLNVVTISINVVFSLILLKYFGLLGVALGTFLATVIADVFIIPRKASKVYDMKLIEYFIQSIWPSFWPAIALFFITHIINKYFEVHSFLDILSHSFPGMVAYALLFWHFSLNLDEKMKVLTKIAKLNFSKKKSHI